MSGNFNSASRTTRPPISDRTAPKGSALPKKPMTSTAPDGRKTFPAASAGMRPASDDNAGRSFRKPAGKSSPPAEAVILGQAYFKSVGPRTYAAQLKRAGNGNHFLVLTEGKRDSKTEEVRKTRLFIFSEDFDAFFELMRQARELVDAHPVPEQVRQKRARFWKRREQDDTPATAQKLPPRSPSRTPSRTPSRMPPHVPPREPPGKRTDPR